MSFRHIFNSDSARIIRHMSDLLNLGYLFIKLINPKIPNSCEEAMSYSPSLENLHSKVLL